MLRTILRASLLAIAVAALWAHDDLGGSEALAVDNGYPQSRQDLFRNHWAHPGPCGGVAAPMYISPIPTPPYVGHTWITYQPFEPANYMYPHMRVFTKYHYEPDCATLRNGGKTTTSIIYW